MMKTTYSCISLLALLVILQVWSGCKISKDVVIPDTDLPQTYQGGKTDSASIAAMPWDAFFSDPELKSLITDALAHNNDLQIAIKNIESASLTLKQAKLGNIPIVNLGAAASLSRPSDNSLDGLSLSQELHTKHIEDYSLAASLSWEADIWGKIKSQKEAALAEYLSTEEARKGVQTQLISNVSKGYYNLLTLDAQLAIAKQNVELDDSTLNIIKLQYDAGQVTLLAVQQAQAQKLSAVILVPTFEQQITIQEDAIDILCGRYPDPVKRDMRLENVTQMDNLQAGLPAALLSNRPDVKQAEFMLSEANAKVGYAKANMYPSLTITAEGGLNAFKASNWFNIPASLFGAVAGGFTQPLFEQKKLRTAYNLAKINRDQKVIEFRQSLLIAVGDVSDALVKVDKLKQERQLAAQRTETLKLATSNSQLLFKNGMATYLEVITAQGNVLQSELELASIKNAQLDAKVDLYRSVGGGWR